MKNDLYLWFKYEWKKYIPVILLFLWAAFSAEAAFSGKGRSAEIYDYMRVLFKGMKAYEITGFARSGRTSFTIPGYYLIFHVYIAWVISYFPFRNLKGYGKISIIKYGKKEKWWWNKCIWCVCTVFSFYLAGYAVFVLMHTLAKWNVFPDSIPFLSEMAEKVVGEEGLSRIGRKEMILLCLVVPYLISAGLSVLQMVLSLVIKPLYSQIFVIAVLVISAYKCSRLLPGNYFMLMRSHHLMGARGVYPGMGMAMGVGMCMVGVAVGTVLVRKKDII